MSVTDLPAPMDLPAILAALHARIILPPAGEARSACPVCGVSTTRSAAGRPSLCLDCTEDELGVSAYGLAIMREHRISRKRWDACETAADIDTAHWAAFRRYRPPVRYFGG